MIRIKNQICCVFSIGDVEDFIDIDNLISYELHLSAGNLRPLFKMSFILRDMKVLKYLNAGNILYVNFGVDEPSVSVTQFELQGDSVNLAHTLGSRVDIVASLWVEKFTNQIKNKSYGEVNSIDVIREIATNSSFGLKTNISKTIDKQIWYQSGQTDWQYLKEVWMHTYINSDTFIAFGFDTENFYYYDIRELVSKDPKWKFCSYAASTPDSRIINFGQYTTENLYGSLSDLVGKNITNTTFNITTGEFKNYDYKLKNFTAMDTTKINLNAVGSKNFTYDLISGDVHENYVVAENQNIRNNIMFSSYCIYIPLMGQFNKLKLLDTVEVATQPKDERVAGMSFITAICYQYSDKRLNINVTLNKEAPSGIKGDKLSNG